MKSITLTEEHKSKLLEMCNLLFPETKWHFWESNDESYPDGMIGYNQHIILGKHKEIQPALEMHWFEFCMTHLLYQFLKHSDVENLKYFDNVFMFWATHNTNSHIIDSTSKHPVDYFYEEFKKLK